MSRNIVSALENWKELFKTPRSKDERCGITKKSLIRKVLRDVAEFKLRDGTNALEAIHMMISEYLPIDYEDDNEYVLDVISVGLTKDGEDPFLSRTLGKTMLKWIKDESGLMDYMPFRIILGSQILAFTEVISEMFPLYGEGGTEDLSEFCWDVMKRVVFNERNIMPLLIVPLFMCYRGELRRLIWERRKNH